MLTLSTTKQAALSADAKIIDWLFEVTTVAPVTYYWSTRDVTYDSQAYSFKVLSDTFNGITLRRNKTELGMITPDTTRFKVSNPSTALDPSDFIDASIKITLIVGSGQEEIGAWRFTVKSCVAIMQTLHFVCDSFIMGYLDQEWPKTQLISSLTAESGTVPQDNMCVPIPFGTCYAPLRPILVSNVRWYLLGPSTYTYNIDAVHAPEGRGDSEWLSSGFTMTQTTKTINDTLGNSHTYKMFQPEIADDGVGGYEAAVWEDDRSGLRDMPTKFSRSDKSSMTSPGDIIDFFLQDIGIPSSYIDTAGSFATAESSMASAGIVWNGAANIKEKAKIWLARMLAMCNCRINITDKIELDYISNATVKTITDADILKTGRNGASTFSYEPAVRNITDAGYIAIAESGSPQNLLQKVLCPAKTTSANISGDVVQMPWLINESDASGITQVAQKLGRLLFQAKYGPKDTASFSGKASLLVLQPGDIVTVSGDNYGGSFNAMVDAVKIGPRLKTNISLIRHSFTLDSFGDLSTTAISFATDSSGVHAWAPVISGPPTTPSSGIDPNALPGIIKVGNILIDGINGIIESDPNFEIDASGNVTMAGTVTATGGAIAGWTISSTKISKTGIELDSSSSHLKAFSGSNYVTISPSGLIGYDSVLGQTLKLPTDGSPPVFSSGTIKEVEFQVYSSGVFKTDDDPSSNGGLIINNTDMKGYNSSGLKLFQVIYDGTDQGDFYVGDYDNGNHGWFFDHSTGIMDYIGSLNDRTPWVDVAYADTATGWYAPAQGLAVNKRYRIDTTGGVIVFNLNALSPVENDWIQWIDEVRNFGTNNFRFYLVSDKFEGYSDGSGLYIDCTWDRCGGVIQFTGATNGWKIL